MLPLDFNLTVDGLRADASVNTRPGHVIRKALSSGHGHERPFPTTSFHLGGGDRISLSVGLLETLAAVRNGDNTDAYSSYQLAFTPAHIIFKTRVDQATLRLSAFEPPGDVANLSTKDLQKPALHYVEDPDVFSDFSKWQRKDGGSR